MPKNILIVCSHFWPSRGGLESRMGQFGAELVVLGYEVTVLTGQFPGRTSDTYQGTTIVSVPEIELPQATRAAVASAKYNACILVQDPLGNIIWGVEGMDVPPATRLIIQPIINEDGYSRWKDHPQFSGRLAQILQQASSAVAMTRSGPDMDYFSQAGIDGVYLPNATVPAAPEGDFRQHYGIAPDRFLVLHVANLFWVKNHIGLIDALPDIPPSWQVVMIGHPSGEPDCVEAVRRKLAERPEILFIPGISRGWVASAMQAADVVLLSSLGEGSPNTILEAMSLSRPWLATPQCGAVHDHLGGIICDLGSFRKYLSAFEKNSALRTELGRIGNEHWRQCYSWPVVLAGWQDLIEHGTLRHQFVPDAGLADRMTALKRRLAEVDDLLSPAKSNAALVSVIVLAGEDTKNFDRRLASVLGQDHATLQIIVANWGNTPLEPAIRQKEDSRITYLVLTGKQSMASACNQGLRLADGRYIAILNETDEYLPTHLSSLLAAMRGSDKRLAYSPSENGAASYPSSETASGNLDEDAARNIRDALLVENVIPDSAYLFERTLLDDVGLIEESGMTDEYWDWLLRANQRTGFTCLAHCTVTRIDESDILNHLADERQLARIYATFPAPNQSVEASRDAHSRKLFGTAYTNPLGSPAVFPDEYKEIVAATRQGKLDIIDLVSAATRLIETQGMPTAADLYKLWLANTESPLKYIAAFNLGCLLETIGEIAAAEEAYRHALSNNPTFCQARHSLARQLEQQGKLSEAISHWRWISTPQNGVADSAPEIFLNAQEKLRQLSFIH